MTTTIDPPLSVLLVEDNPNDARLVKRYLRHAETAFLPDEIEIHHEVSLEPALDILDTEDIDLFLLDLGLPESSGPETYHRVSDRTETIPVIVLTGLKDKQAAVDLLQEGAQDYLNKDSLEEDRLVRSIRYALERQEREAELRTKSEQLELLNRILRHDIQNDLQVVLGWTDAAKQAAADDVAPHLEKVLETSEHILELTETSRELIQLVGGKDDIEHEPIDLTELLAEELDIARNTHPEADFRVVGTLPAITVKANMMLSSVFRNLFNNAVQHNDSSTPAIELSADNGEGVVRITVADNGPGVPDKEDIFGKGERGLDSDGTGIGLYLVETLVTEFDGRVWVEDNEPTGAVFTVELPLP